MEITTTQTPDILIEGCRNNCRKSQEAIYKKYSAKMKAICMRYMRDRTSADDLLQTSFIKVFGRIGSYNGSGPFELWIKRIVINSALDELRRKKSAILQYSIDAGLSTEQFGCPADMDERINKAYLQHCLYCIPQHLRKPFQLHVIEGYSHREIAGMTGISATLSRVQVVRARQCLKKIIMETRVVQHAASYRGMPQ